MCDIGFACGCFGSACRCLGSACRQAGHHVRRSGLRVGRSGWLVVRCDLHVPDLITCGAIGFVCRPLCFVAPCCALSATVGALWLPVSPCGSPWRLVDHTCDRVRKIWRVRHVLIRTTCPENASEGPWSVFGSVRFEVLTPTKKSRGGPLMQTPSCWGLEGSSYHPVDGNQSAYM